MLRLSNIKKDYVSGDTKVEALRGLDLKFRKSEFVAVLGPSGCGKTTLLNIIGGLDRYTSGDLKINGKSTKEYTDSDWDAYRNHSIGFVFQSYNLISHQTVLSNVELALTLSGVSRDVRRKKATDVLTRVGLADQIHKKPNQLSGGQMQRVAIARALINDPDILLADEPTGALDTETSVQVMDILAQVAKEKLVIMVTHNPDLADKYANRIIRLLDGKMIDDTNSYQPEEDAQIIDVNKKQDKRKKSKKDKQKKPSMSFITALSLSLNNLLTKKTRTILTSFAGSIGIIGIALILSLSSGFQAYINGVEEDTLSSYPMSIQKEDMDISSLISSMTGNTAVDRENYDPDKIYSNDITLEMFGTMMSEIKTNNLKEFKKFVDSNEELNNLSSAIQYTYNIELQIYNTKSQGKNIQVNPSSVFDSIGMGNSGGSPMMQGFGGMQIFQEMIDNDELLQSQYDVIAGKWPTNKNEVVLVVSGDNEINDLVLYALGIRNPDELTEIISAITKGEKIEKTTTSYTYDELLNTEFSVLANSDLYKKGTDGVWEDMSEDTAHLNNLINSDRNIPLNVVGILRPAEGVTATSITGVVGYTKELTDYIINDVNASLVVAEQKANPDTDILTGLPFDDGVNSKPSDEAKILMFKEYVATLTDTEKAKLMRKIVSSLTDEQKAAIAESEISTMSEEDKTTKIYAYIDSMTKDEIIAMMRESGAPDGQISMMEAMEEREIKVIMQGMFGPSDDTKQREARDNFILGLIIEEQTEKQFENMNESAIAAKLNEKIQAADNESLVLWFDSYMPDFVSDSTLEENLQKLGAADYEDPASINIYPVDFDAKERIAEIIEEYNNTVAADSTKGEAYKISYTDYIGLFMSSVSKIINTISIVLIAFVGISLFVSSIMIGIITYISVLERTKEIGILRSIGASKRDISRVFNAETIIVGFISGIFGIVSTILLDIPINIIIKALSNIPNVAKLPLVGGIVLVLVSVGLTFIAGLIPAKIAAKKDPVVALRTE